MSVDLVQLGEDIGEAKAEAEAALAVAEVAVVASALTEATANEEEEDHEGHTCCEHCERDIAELRAMLVSLSDKYDEDMDLISRVLDELLSVEEDVEEVSEEEGVELISPESEESHEHTGESTGHESEPERHTDAGSSGDREEQAETPKPQAEHRTHKQRPATSGRVRFRRGR